MLQFNAVVVYRNIFQDNRESHFLQKSSTKRCVIGIANCAVVYKIAICIGIKWVSGKIKKDIKVN